MPVTIVIHRDRMERILRDPEGPLGDRLFRSGIRVKNRAQRLCPVDTGRLRSSINYSQVRKQPDGLFIMIGTNVDYARFVELGTRFMRARPYLRLALEQEVR